MGSTRRFVPALAPLLFAIALSAPAEEAAKPGDLAGADETLAEALANAAKGLSLLPAAGGDDAAAQADLSGVAEEVSRDLNDKKD